MHGFHFYIHANPAYMGTGWDQSVVTNCATVKQGGGTPVVQGNITINNTAS
jgi:hypothetical protein